MGISTDGARGVRSVDAMAELVARDFGELVGDLLIGFKDNPVSGELAPTGDPAAAEAAVAIKSERRFFRRLGNMP